MALERSLVVIAYDTPSDKRRRKLVRTATDFANRVQKSVFEGKLSAAERYLLWKRLEHVLLIDEDALRIYSLCERCQRESYAVGVSFHESPEQAWTL